MKLAHSALVIFASLVVPSFVAAQGNVSSEPAKLLTAVCKSPSGTTMLAGSRGELEADGFGGGFFTYSWKVGDSTATIVSQSGSAAGSTPRTEQATAVPASGFVTFFVLYDRAVWVHSLFLDKKTVLISRHVDSAAAGAPLGGLYTTSCSIAVQ